MAVVNAVLRWLSAGVLLFLTACAPWQPAADRGAPAPQRSESRVVQTPPAWYQVRRGETLYAIAFRYGQDWRNLARWNGIESPYTIRPGQELRMSAPPARPSRPAPPVETQAPADEPQAAGHGDDPAPDGRTEEPAETRARPADEPAPDAAAAARTRQVAGVTWQWPTEGRVLRAFDPGATRKGVGIAGEAGKPIHAAAAGEVVYSGTALIGYGELIIIKHSDTLLSAYGYNRRRLVGEGDRVRRGQKIAEMGRDDRREELLHFEIRRDGEPVNPLDYLPRR